MKSHVALVVHDWGGISFLSGIILAGSLIFLVPLPNLRGPQVTTFLIIFLVASTAYVVAVLRMGRDSLPLSVIWGLALLFRFLLLLTEQSLSDDVFRFIWDGHLLRQGINPFAQAVSSQLLDSYEIPVRTLVNHDWMASPYLPAAQLIFIPIPGEVLAHRVAAVILDLSIGLLLVASLRRLSIPAVGVLIYLWNPLILTEFSNGAHLVDAWMIFLVILSFWLMLRVNDSHRHKNLFTYGAVISLAAATLTKGLPAILVPIFFRRWRWKYLFLYAGLVIAVLFAFSLTAGWGLFGPLDGTGVFGAFRIYTAQWNFNSSIYHWLEVLLSGYQTPGAVPPGIVGQTPILVARFLTSAATLLVSLLTGIWAWRLDSASRAGYLVRTLALFRLSVIPIAAYLLLTHTVHPWYAAFIVALLPFLLPAEDEGMQVSRFIWPWLYLSLAVSLSYVTYLDPNDLREYSFVRPVVYLPVFGLLIWAAWPWLYQGLILILDSGMRWARIKRQ
jgi:hypothetical protein